MNPRYEQFYRDPLGWPKQPFALLSDFVHRRQVPRKPADDRAIVNMYQFIESVCVICDRLRGHIAAFERDEDDECARAELNLDFQTLLLMTQQFFEDSVFVLKLFLPKAVGTQLSPRFSEFRRRVPERAPDLALSKFLVAEEGSFNRLKDIRDDITHRTAFGRVRTAQAPGLLALARAASGGQLDGGRSFQDYIAEIVELAFAWACIASDYVAARMGEQQQDNEPTWTAPSVFGPTRDRFNPMQRWELEWFDANHMPSASFGQIRREWYEALAYFIGVRNS